MTDFDLHCLSLQPEFMRLHNRLYHRGYKAITTIGVGLLPQPITLSGITSALWNWRTLMRAAISRAIRRKVWAASDCGALTTIGRPKSPPLRTSASSGIRPRNGTLRD